MPPRRRTCREGDRGSGSGLLVPAEDAQRPHRVPPAGPTVAVLKRKSGPQSDGRRTRRPDCHSARGAQSHSSPRPILPWKLRQVCQCIDGTARGAFRPNGQTSEERGVDGRGHQRPLYSVERARHSGVGHSSRAQRCERASTSKVRLVQRTSAYGAGTFCPEASAALTSRAWRHWPRYSNPGQVQVTSAFATTIS